MKKQIILGLLLGICSVIDTSATIENKKINAQDNKRHTALLLAIEKNNINLAKRLLCAGTHPDIADKNGRTPLMIAAQNGNLEMVALLIAFGAYPNSRDNEGKTPLMYSCDSDKKNIHVYQFLLNNGANPLLMSNSGDNACTIQFKRNNSGYIEPKLLELHKNYSRDLNSFKDDPLANLKVASGDIYLKMLYANTNVEDLYKILLLLDEKDKLKEYYKKCNFLYLAKEVKEKLRSQGHRITFNEFTMQKNLLKSKVEPDIEILLTPDC